jgi:hypothetical protein
LAAFPETGCWLCCSQSSGGGACKLFNYEYNVSFLSYETLKKEQFLTLQEVLFVCKRKNETIPGMRREKEKGE